MIKKILGSFRFDLDGLIFLLLSYCFILLFQGYIIQYGINKIDEFIILFAILSFNTFIKLAYYKFFKKEKGE